jgi:outer membrane protein TolC
VRTPYVRPAVDAPAQWEVITPAAAGLDGGRWWQRFGDTELDRVIEAALARNNDLAAAAIRVRRAELQAGLAANALVPSLNAGLNSSANRDVDDGGPTGRANSASIGVSYVVDLWGRLGSQRDAARWEAEATAADLASARLALIGTTAGLYWQIAWLNARIAASEASIKIKSGAIV